MEGILIREFLYFIVAEYRFHGADTPQGDGESYGTPQGYGDSYGTAQGDGYSYGTGILRIRAWRL